VPEGLFDHQAGVVRAAGAPEGLDHRAEQARGWGGAWAVTRLAMTLPA
jgi:hypothetical protein